LVEREARRIAEEAKRAGDLQLRARASWRCADFGEYFAKLVGELTHNAFKFSKAGTPVLLRLSAGADATLLQVTDRGRGMSPDQSPSSARSCSLTARPTSNKGSVWD
jgi:two-component system sensor histidine kinase/response regulator